MARINRGAKGIMISCAKVRRSESHRRAVDCWISSSAKPINVVHRSKWFQRTFVVQLMDEDFHDRGVVDCYALPRYPRYV